nr:uncharacterized protein LOC115263054 [Aedes albopictus]
MNRLIGYFINANFTAANYRYLFMIFISTGMIEVKQRQTAKFLKEKILELLQSYGVTIKQLLAVTCDNGANMMAAVKQLQKQYVVEHPSLESYDDVAEDVDEAGERLIEDLMEELQKSVSLVRCAVHTMQLAVTDVVKATDANIKEITTIAKSTRKIAYKAMFDYNKVSVPPLYSRTRWNGVYKMLNYFKQHEEFYKDIGRQYPELDLTNHWNYINEYVSAFEPVFVCTNKMQAKHVSLSDFYVHWLNAVMQVGLLQDNSIAKTLVTALTQRLEPLKSNMAFKASLLVDPRFNYLNAKTLLPEEKEQTRSYMLATWERIKQLDPEISNEGQGAAQQPRQTNQFDAFLTNLFGGLPPTKDQQTKSLNQQLNALDLEAHQSFSFDVFEYWKNRQKTHPELSKLALVFQSVPSNQINVERCFSGMALTLTERRTNITDEALENILLIKLNSDLIDEIVPENSFE